MLIPISILWNVRIPWEKKAIFIGLFSLTLSTIVVAIVRTVDVSVTRRGTGREDTSFLWLWSAIQASLGMSSSDPSNSFKNVAHINSSPSASCNHLMSIFFYSAFQPRQDKAEACIGTHGHILSTTQITHEGKHHKEQHNS